MDNDSIISIPDSETSAVGGALNETFSPQKRPSMGTPAAATKRPAPEPLNTTFSPEEKKSVPATTSKMLDGTFSPVRNEPEAIVVKQETPDVRASRTPKKKLLTAVLSKNYDSPAPNPPVPEILVVPPSTDRKPLRRSIRTPAKIVEPVATRASTRRSTRQQQTPLKAVPEKRRGRKSKKDVQEEQEETEPAVPMETEQEETQKPAVVPTKSPAKKLKIAEEEEPPLPNNTAGKDENTEVKMTEEIAKEPAPEIKREESEDKPEGVSRSMLFDTEQPTLVEVTVPDHEEPVNDGDDDDDDGEEADEDDIPLEETLNDFQAPMFACDVLPKSIRKRSLSLTDMKPPLPKRNFRVQFHSPGNMEKTITEIDESLYLNFTKSFASSFSIPSSATTSMTVSGSATKAHKPPMRRKRSMSNAETEVDKLATLQFFCTKSAAEEKAKKTAAAAPGSATKKVPTPSPRKKMPNFAAIHQSIFQQMESLTDFKERKKERAQFLLATPTSIAATASRSNIVKPVSRGAIGKASSAAALKKSGSNLMKPKNRVIGRKQAPTTGIKLTEKKLAAILQTTDFPEMAEPTVMVPMTATDSNTELKAKEAIAAKPEEIKENLVASKASGIKVPRVYTGTAAAVRPKLPLNVTTTSMTGLKNRTLTRPTPSKRNTLPQFPVKPAASVVGADAKQANAYKIVKGVRMNRRFELMMKHRNTNKTTEKN